MDPAHPTLSRTHTQVVLEDEVPPRTPLVLRLRRDGFGQGGHVGGTGGRGIHPAAPPVVVQQPDGALLLGIPSIAVAEEDEARARDRALAHPRSPSPVPRGVFGRLRRGLRRHRATIVTAAGVILVVIAVGALAAAAPFGGVLILIGLGAGLLAMEGTSWGLTRWWRGFRDDEHE